MFYWCMWWRWWYVYVFVTLYSYICKRRRSKLTVLKFLKGIIKCFFYNDNKQKMLVILIKGKAEYDWVMNNMGEKELLMTVFCLVWWFKFSMMNAEHVGGAEHDCLGWPWGVRCWTWFSTF